MSSTIYGQMAWPNFFDESPSQRDKLQSFAQCLHRGLSRTEAARWQAWLSEFLDPGRIQERPVCGPEGQLSSVVINPVLDTGK
jgi:hypothetical protein